MSIETFLDQFVTAVDFQEAVPIAASTKLADLPEWDSLAALGVIVMFDIDYGKTVTGPDLAKCATIEDLFKLTQA